MTIADKGARLGNFIIDLIAIMFVYMALAMPLYIIYPEMAEDRSEAMDILMITVFILYYFIFEATIGKTPGKMLTKTAVIDLHGNKPGLLKIFTRTIMRLIPYDFLAFLFGNSGLHDLISGTTVISTRKQYTTSG